MITDGELRLLHDHAAADIRILVDEVRRLNAVVEMIRKLDGNSYPVAGMETQRQSVDRDLLRQIREAIK
jgi:hypothetical protein